MPTEMESFIERCKETEARDSAEILRHLPPRRALVGFDPISSKPPTIHGCITFTGNQDGGMDLTVQKLKYPVSFEKKELVEFAVWVLQVYRGKSRKWWRIRFIRRQHIRSVWQWLLWRYLQT